MALCTIKIHYPNANGWNVGDVVEITSPQKLIEEGKVELYVEPTIQEEITPEVVIQPKKRGRKKK